MENWLQALVQLLPIAAEIVPGGGPIAAVAMEFKDLLEAEVKRRQEETGMTRQEILDAATQQYAEDIKAAYDLLQLGR